MYLYSVSTFQSVGLPPHSLHVKWTSGPDMPFGLSGHIQSVAVQGTVYVGGGYANYVDDECIVMAYGTCAGTWHKLTQYRARRFAMVGISNQLVVVGGCSRGYEDSNMLGMWDVCSRQWTHPYPPMPTARSDTSAVAHEQWLLVAGGMSQGYCVSIVEVLDLDNKWWFSVQSTPTPWSTMKSTLVGDTWYLMGGYVEDGGSTDTVYSIHLPSLLSRDKSSISRPRHTWKIISGLGLNNSSPLCIGGFLLAVGGMGVENSSNVSNIHRYLPDTDEWVRVAELPSALNNCTCTVTSDGEVVVAGGYYNTVVQVSISKYVYIGYI